MWETKCRRLSVGEHPPMDTKGYVSRIQRACTGDGPGYRTTVFFQGCHLACPWCHNPDYRPFGTRLSRNPHRCIACGRCDDLAPAAGPASEMARRVGECPAGALTLLGREMSVAAVMQVVRRDLSYYRHTGGGMTLSGGEPLMQPDFALALLQAAAAEGIGTAVETSCAMAPQIVAHFAGRADLFLCGIKASREAYPRLIGCEADLILQNIATLAATGRPLIIRVPCVVGVNFDDGLAALVNQAAAIPGVSGVELLPYHDFGRGKAAMTGLVEPQWGDMRAPTADELAHFKELLRAPLIEND